jgi:hypothetical protein
MTVRGHQRRNRRHTLFLPNQFGSRHGWSPLMKTLPPRNVWTDARDAAGPAGAPSEAHPSNRGTVNESVPDDA